jgi:hypothetical protein
MTASSISSKAAVRKGARGVDAGAQGGAAYGVIKGDHGIASQRR